MGLHSTLTKRKEPVSAGPGGTCGSTSAGPTVYGRVHIGNARPFVVFSVLKRFLERRGMRVRLVSNLTDINDKIYDAASAEGIRSDELARRYSDATSPTPTGSAWAGPTRSRASPRPCRRSSS